jgi:CheY-like chemotaxis protein/HPt (histidine-containing phosphotransfer) domain-containing protein
MKDVEFLKNNGVDVDKSLELLGDMDTYNEVLLQFLNLIEDKVNLIQKYKSKNDMANYSIEVHSLKSDVRYLGFMALGDEAYQLELKSKANDTTGVNELHDEFIKNLSKAVSIANKYLYGEDKLYSTINIQDAFNKIDVSSLDPMDQALILQSKNVVVNDNNTPKEGIILIADDSEIVANFVKSVFCDKYEVVIAEDGKKTIDLVNDPEFRKKIKACLIDLNMPNINGLEVLENFKNNNYFVHLPVAVISGVEDKEILNKARSYPIIDVLQKPFNERDIKYCVEKCLALYF